MALRDIIIDGKRVKAGSHKKISLDVGRLPSDTSISINAHVFRSEKKGPTVLVLAGVHGDEINGIEFVRRTLESDLYHSLKMGNIIVIPVLNVYGFINFNRYVPDGKDVNRSFPGTLSGSLASRIARTLTKYILPHVDYILDFHTGGDSRYNYPQIRYSKLDKKAQALARIFYPPFIIESGIIPRSLRKTARERKIPALVYEGGESIRLDGLAIDHAHKGMLRVLSHLRMVEDENVFQPDYNCIIIKKTTWVRAPYSGIFIWSKQSGTRVVKGEPIGSIKDPYGTKTVVVISSRDGYIIGHNNASVVNHGDALFNIGYESEVFSP